VRAFVEDPGVDCAVISNVPLTKSLQTLPPGAGHAEDLTRPGGFAARTIEIFRATDKPVVVNIDSGPLYDPLAGYLEKQGSRCSGEPTKRSASSGHTSTASSASAG